MDNDVNAAAVGEQWLGNARNKKNVLFMAVGTGIGSGIIINNQLYRGAFGAAGEMGYIVTDKNDMKNEFKPIFHRYGYLESVAGGMSIGKRLTELVRKNPDHPHHEQAKETELSGETAFILAKKGDEAAKTVVDQAIEHLAYGVLGGGVLKSADYILPRVREIVNQYLPSSVELKTAHLGESAGVLGAVSLFLREHDSMVSY
ncbi:transcriptional regulator/sugar kinase [Mycobacteroides abscessus subsp. abscessus]|nr:transcriptional regulator/sugar kinase [Mycobacteroides abscessus subsp. abscessus]